MLSSESAAASGSPRVALGDPRRSTPAATDKRPDATDPVLSIHISSAGGQTVCEVEGVVDQDASGHLSDALQVALSLTPSRPLLVDFGAESRLTLPVVCDVVDRVHAAHPGRHILIRGVPGQHAETAHLLPLEAEAGVHHPDARDRVDASASPSGP